MPKRLKATVAEAAKAAKAAERPPVRLILSCLAVAITQAACSHLPTAQDTPRNSFGTAAHVNSGQQGRAVSVRASADDMQSWQGTVIKSEGAPPRPQKTGSQSPTGNENHDSPEPQVRIFEGTGTVIAPQKTRHEESLSGEAGEFNFQDAPIAEVIHVILGEILDANYVLHQPISGTLTLSTNKPITKDTAMSLLETALQANGLLMERDNRGFYHIGTPESLRGIVSAPRVIGSGYPPLPPGYGIVLLPLQYISATEMADILRPVMDPSSLLRIDTARNLLVLAGTRSQAEGWLAIAKTFDVDLLAGMSVGIFPLKYITVNDVERALSIVGGDSAFTSGSEAAGAPGHPHGGAAPHHRGAAQQQNQGHPAGLGTEGPGIPASAQVLPVLGSLRIVPLERLNSIMVITPHRQYLEEVRKWIERLDQPNDTNQPQLFVYKVQNGSATNLAQVLGGIFGGTAAGGAPVADSGVAPGLGQARQTSGMNNFAGGGNQIGMGGMGIGAGISSGIGMGSASQSQQPVNQAPLAMDLGAARVIADPVNNAILVWSTPREYDKILVALKRLDVEPAQVMIEASIIEVRLTHDLQFGLRWAFENGFGDGRKGTAGSLSMPSTLNDAIIQSRTQNPDAFNWALTNRFGLIRSMLTMLASRSLVKMLSSPSLLVLDNHPASIVVGDQIPVRTGTIDYSNNQASSASSYQYRDTGVILHITPSVNAGDMVTLTVDQAVTNVSGVSGPGGNPIFMQRQISSRVAVRSGQPIVLGGLISESTANSNNGIPGLVNVPVLRHAFGTTADQHERTELLVILTPTIVRSDDQLREAGDELRERMQALLRTRINDIKDGGPVLPGEEDLRDMVSRPLSKSSLPPPAAPPVFTNLD